MKRFKTAAVLFLITIACVLFGAQEEKEYSCRTSHYSCDIDISNSPEDLERFRDISEGECFPSFIEDCAFKFGPLMEDYYKTSKIIAYLSSHNDSRTNAIIVNTIRNREALSDKFYDSIFIMDRSKYYFYYESLLYLPSTEVCQDDQMRIAEHFADSHPEEISLVLQSMFNSSISGLSWIGPRTDRFFIENCKSKSNVCVDIIFKSFNTDGEFIVAQNNLLAINRLKECDARYVDIKYKELLSNLLEHKRNYKLTILLITEMERRNILTCDMVNSIRNKYGDKLDNKLVEFPEEKEESKDFDKRLYMNSYSEIMKKCEGVK